MRITERDRWILDAIARTLFLTTRHVADLHFSGSRWAANKRLRRLLDAGVIRAWVPKRDADNIYSLTPAGRTILHGDHGDTEPAIRCPRGLDGQIDHLLAINTVRIALGVELAQDDAEIRWWRSDWEIRACSRLRAIPDATFAVSWNARHERVFHLEVDHHTRTPRKFLAKLLRYGHGRAYSSGDEPAIVLVIGTDPHCIERYRLGLDAIPINFDVYFATFEAMAKFGVAGPIWRPPHGEEILSLRALSSLPCGKEGGAAKNSVLARSCTLAAARTSPMELGR